MTKSADAWENFRRRVAELGGEVLEPEWLGAQKPHRCRCANGHECRPWPTWVQQGGGICPACAGNDKATAREAFYKRIAQLGGTVLESEWLGVMAPHRCLCANGHECKPRPHNVQQGCGICIVCVGLDSITAREDFYKRVADQGGTVLEPEWLGTSKPHRCLCVNGHECKPWPSNVQQGRGICKLCAGLDSAHVWDDFRKRVAELGGVVLESEYLGRRKPHRCLCPEKHECSPRPSSLQRNRGMCLTCAGMDPVIAWETFCKRVTRLGGVVLEPKWLGAKAPHRCRCVNGHACAPCPDHIRGGQGICRKCKFSEQNILYVVRNPVINCVKFGITSHDGSARLRNHRSAGFISVIYLKAGLDKGLALHAEQKIRAALVMVGATPVRGREYFGDEYTALILNEIGNWV